MKAALKRFFTGQGESLPAASESSRGVLAIKRAASTEDEVHIGLVDSSNVPAWRRLLTKTYADTLYADIASDHDPVTVVDGTGIDFTLTGQQITAEPKFAGTGAAGTVARSDHSHGSAESGRSRKTIHATPGGASFTTVGIGSLTTTGTMGNTDDTVGPWTSFTTGGTSGNTAGFASPDATYIDWEPTLLMYMGDCSGTTTRRIWAGLFESSPSGSDDPAIDGAGFRYSTGSSDANWQAWSNDGTSGGTITDTNVVFAANTKYDFELRCTAGQILFYIDGALVATHSTNLPASTTLLQMRYSLTTLTNATRAMSVGKYDLYHNP